MININISKWKEFKLCDVFTSYERGKRLVELDREPGDIPFVTAGFNNEGVSSFISNPSQKRFKNKITIDMFCNVFYRDYEFCCDDNIIVLTNDSYNEYVCLFITAIIRLEKVKFQYGRQYRLKNYNKHLIKLPVDANNEIDLKYMEDFIKELQERERESGKNLKDSIKTSNKKGAKPNISSWKEFTLSQLFEIIGSKTTPLEVLETYGKGLFPYVTTKATNNGVDGFYDYKTEKENCLVIDSAVNGYCSFQEKPFSASDHVEVLSPKFKMNQYIAMFLVTLINKDIYRYSYGRKRNQIKIKNDIVKLPVDSSGNPDWKYMENYIKSLPYADRI